MLPCHGHAGSSNWPPYWGVLWCCGVGKLPAGPVRWYWIQLVALAPLLLVLPLSALLLRCVCLLLLLPLFTLFALDFHSNYLCFQSSSDPQSCLPLFFPLCFSRPRHTVASSRGVHLLKVHRTLVCLLTAHPHAQTRITIRASHKDKDEALSSWLEEGAEFKSALGLEKWISSSLMTNTSVYPHCSSIFAALIGW